MPPPTTVRTLTIDGKQFAIALNDQGNFYTTIPRDTPDGDDQIVKADTLKKLESKLRSYMRTHGRIAIPVSIIEEGWRGDKVVIRQATLTGIHASNGNILVKFEDTGDTEQLRNSSVYRGLPPEEVEEGQRLHQATLDTEAAWRAWKEARDVNARRLIEAAQSGIEAAEKV